MTIETENQTIATDGFRSDAVASATPRPDTNFGAWLAGPPQEREFVSHADETAYFFGSLNGNI